MKEKRTSIPRFVNEAQEADWWASREGREFVKQKAAGSGKPGDGPKGSRLVGKLNGGAEKSTRYRTCSEGRTPR